MTRAEIIFRDNTLKIQCNELKKDESREIKAEEKEHFRQWIESYRNALNEKDNAAILLNIGQDIYKWLNGSQGWLDDLTDEADPPLIIEFTVPGKRPDSDDLMFLEIPWELLAKNSLHLAADKYLIYSPIRRIGKRGEPESPSECRISVVFMAASPRENRVHLKFEEEESAIIDATGAIGMDFTVEESGTVQLLAESVAQENPLDVLHISCHGTIKEEPALVLETDEGESHPVTPDMLSQKLGTHKPRLLFLSACMTAEPVPVKESQDKMLNSFSSKMITLGSPAVLGWGGSVRDREATAFASRLYEYLARFESLEAALALARLKLLKPEENLQGFKDISRDWHLARLYLGKKGGGVFSKGKQARRLRGADQIQKEFLNTRDKKIQVAGRREFVGRRRQIQQILREFRNPQHAGVLVHGFGGQGKSSLALRIATRLPDYQLVVIHDDYSAEAILEAFGRFVPSPDITRIVNEYRDAVRKDASQLLVALNELIKGPCRDIQKDETGRAVNWSALLVIDDFEQVLTEPEPNEQFRVKKENEKAIASVIQAFIFSGGETRSRLLITGRYCFSLKHGKRDLAKNLMALHLPPMEFYEQKKQATAKEKAVILSPQYKGETRARACNAADSDLGSRCIRAARGNPRLQNLLFMMSLEEPEACERALKEIDEYIREGKAPNEEGLIAFLNNLVIDELIGLLSDREKEMLRAATLFNTPVPVETLEHTAEYLGLVDKEELRGLGNSAGLFTHRMRGLGLLEQFEDMVKPDNLACSVNELVKPKTGGLKENEKSFIAQGAVKDLFERWGGKTGKRPYTADYELTRIAILAKDTEVIGSSAEDAILWLREGFLYREAARIAKDTVQVLDDAGVKAAPRLLRMACERCKQIGDMKAARGFIARAIDGFKSDKEKDESVNEELAHTLSTHALLLEGFGEVEKALSLHYDALNVYKKTGKKRSKALILERIARILTNKGEIDKALEFHQEALVIYEEVKDLREKAITMGSIARIKVSKGEVADALIIYEEILQIFQDLGDQRSKAVYMGDIARIKFDKGEVADALRLHEEVLKVYEALGDQWSRAVTLGDIARIKVSKGEVADALRLHEEVLKVYEALGDQRSRAVTLGDIARIKVDKGEVAEALRLHEEELKVYESLGDQRSRAVTLGNIARINVSKGEIDDALIIYEEILQIFQDLGNLQQRAVVLGDIARIKVSKGEVAEALKLQQERLEVNKGLGDLDGQAAALYDMAQIELQQESYQKAFEHLAESYTLFMKIGRLDGICIVGMDLGNLLCQAGQKEEGGQILKRSIDGFRKLGWEQKAQEAEAIYRDCV